MEAAADPPLEDEMTQVHFEPFVHLAGLTHDDALIAWGGFYFRDPDRDDDAWHIVEDPELGEVEDGRQRGSIGVSSEPFGDARVEVIELATGDVVAEERTSESNHVWVSGLQPDTWYRYRIFVDDEPWAEGPRRDWVTDRLDSRGRDLEASGLTYDTRFRTFPDPDTPAPLRFAVLGDYGVGILAGGGRGERQSRLAAALERAVDHAGVRLIITTGDNIYLGEEDTVAGTGNHDDDWYYSFYEPYRYAISRVPVYPGVGNHDTGDTEVADNRDQLADNLFTELRFTSRAEMGRASIDPGLFYRVRYGSDIEFVAVDSTTASGLDHEHFIEHPDHKAFLEETFDVSLDDVGWRIPFSHHPPYCAGPKHHNARYLIDHLVPLLQDADVPVMFSGHEHNFQHQQVDGIDFIVTGAAGKLREGRPDRLDEAGTHCWADRGHFLIVDIDGDRMTIHPVTDVDDGGRFTYLEPVTPEGEAGEVPIVVHRRSDGPGSARPE